MGTDVHTEEKMLHFWKFSSLKLHSTSFWKLQSNVSAALDLSAILSSASWHCAPAVAATLQSQHAQNPGIPLPNCVDQYCTENSFLWGKTEISCGFLFLISSWYSLGQRSMSTNWSELSRCPQDGWSTCLVKRSWGSWAWRGDGFGGANSSPVVPVRGLPRRWRQVLHSCTYWEDVRQEALSCN